MAILRAAAALLVAFIVVAYPLERYSLSYEEARTLWIVRNPVRSGEIRPFSLRTFARDGLDSFTSTFARLNEDAYPSLYYMLLDMWTSLLGQTIFAARLFSALCAVIALASMYAINKLLFDARAGLWTLALMALIGLTVYYGFTIDLPPLLLALGMFSVWLGLRVIMLRRLPLVVAVVTSILTLLTYFTGVLFFAPLVIHGLWRSRRLTFASVVLCASIAVVPLLALDGSLIWTPRPDWRREIATTAAVRQTIEPAITLIPAYHPAAYYARNLNLTDGITLDLAWRDHSPDELRAYASRFDDVPVVWVMMPLSDARTQAVIDTLRAAGREIGYQVEIGDMSFYRLDRPS